MNRTDVKMSAAKSLFLAGVAAIALSGCGVGSLMGGNGDASLSNTSASQTQINQTATSALPAIAYECPPIRVIDGGGVYSLYAPGRNGQANGLRYQAVLDKQSRNCVVSAGLITVKMGAVGRVLAGPQGSSGTVNVPLRFAVVRDELTVFSQKYDIPVSITPTNQGQEFIKVVEDVTVPYVGGEDIVFYVGFDPNG